jgi:hypothetical protein
MMYHHNEYSPAEILSNLDLHHDIDMLRKNSSLRAYAIIRLRQQGISLIMLLVMTPNPAISHFQIPQLLLATQVDNFFVFAISVIFGLRFQETCSILLSTTTFDPGPQSSCLCGFS